MPQPGFTVAPGDPAALSAAAGWHESVANGLSAHANTIRSAASSASDFWQGEAASAYQSLSGAMAFGFEMAATKSADAATIYRRLAAEVDRCQQEGRRALRQAEHWCDQVIADNRRVTTAQHEVQTAQEQVRTATRELSTAAASPDANGHARVAGAQAALRAAQDRLHRAQTALRAAQRDLDHANDQLRSWDRRGQAAFEDAERAVAQVTGLPVSIQPPPMPGLLTGPVTPLSPTAPASLQHHGGGLLGDVLGVIQDGAQVVELGGGVCAATMFWNGVGEVCGGAAGVASGVSALDGWAQAATHNGSVGAAEFDTAGAVVSGGGGALNSVGKGLVDEGEGAEGAAKGSGWSKISKGRTYQSVGGLINGSGGAAAGGSLGATLKHHHH